jgi:murein DD-endopeptidase MepM/ murein hydrolase activator NlpD
MIQISINLPTKRRLDLNLVKRRSVPNDTPLFPDLGKIRRARSGNKVSRFFRHFFENKKLQRFIGANFAALTIASSFFTTANPNLFNEAEDTGVSTAVVLTTKKSVRYPLDHVHVTQDYKFYHPGIDYDGITGEPVYPIIDGVVEATQYSNYAYGNAILIDHGDNITSLYAHLSKIFVQNNQEVNINTVIGTVGATGHSSGDHLHLEIRENGYPINPKSVLPTQ